jgi:mannose/fructose/N-acetylgalactosamine-specific phosphotransferase system component IIC
MFLHQYHVRFLGICVACIIKKKKKKKKKEKEKEKRKKKRRDCAIDE